MGNNEKVAHVLKAIEYAKQQGIAVNLNQYFTNIPKKGNTGLGGQYRFSGNVVIDGKVVSVTIQLPISRDERVFNTNLLGDSPKYVGRTSMYNSQYNYYFGKGDISINSMTIMVPAEHNDDFREFIE